MFKNDILFCGCYRSFSVELAFQDDQKLAVVFLREMCDNYKICFNPIIKLPIKF